VEVILLRKEDPGKSRAAPCRPYPLILHSLYVLPFPLTKELGCWPVDMHKVIAPGAFHVFNVLLRYRILRESCDLGKTLREGLPES
jgi:hypothetical protein